MSFTSHIQLDTFVDLSTTQSKDCTMYIRIGHVEQNGVLHEFKALEVTLTYNTHDSVYKRIFKGHNMVDKAMEWAFMMSEGDFGSENKDELVKHIERAVHFHRMEGKLQHD